MTAMPLETLQEPGFLQFLSIIWSPVSEQPAWMWYYWAVMVFGFGLLFGSFFNVVIYRVPIKKSIVRPGSHCYSCGTFLKWYDNIPLVSYLLLKGNCRTCGAHFSSRYFFVELLCGLMFLAIYLAFGPTVTLLFHLIFASLLFIGVFTDIDHFILPDSLTIGGFFFGVAAAAVLGSRSIIAEEYILGQDIWHSFSAFYYTREQVPGIAWWAPVTWSLASAAFGWGLLWMVGFLGRIAFRKEAMGGGDIKLFAALGAYLGAINCIWILFLSALLGSVLGLTLMAIHKLLRGDEYDHLELAVIPTAEARSPVAISRHDSSGGGLAVVSDNDSGGIAESADLRPDHPDDAGAADNSREPVKIRVARRTSRQLDTLPYGPYIAVAALLILLFQSQVNSWTREFLMLRPVPQVTSNYEKQL